MKSQTCTRLQFLALLGTALAGGQAPSPQPVKSTWTTVFYDDFNGTAGSPPSSKNWILQLGTSYPGGPAQWGTGEIESYTASANNVHLDGQSHLVIVPQLSSSGQWTSARMETVSDSFAAPAGGMMKVEASIQLPQVTTTNGAGYWPAFWALGGALRANYSSWPGVGEWDLLENVNGNAQVSQGMHCGTNPGGPCNEPSGLGASNLCSGNDCHSGFHTYTMIHNRTSTPETVTIAIDSVVRFSVSQATIGEPWWSNAVHDGLYLVLNVAIGGSYPNAIYKGTTPVKSTISGQPMTVDYVGVWTSS